MIPTLPSKGLDLYRERIEGIMPPNVRGRTWYAQRDWVQDNVAQGPIRDIFVQLMADLTPIAQAKEGTPEGSLADEIRDIADILWYAMDEKTKARADELVAALDDSQPAGGTEMSTR